MADQNSIDKYIELYTLAKKGLSDDLDGIRHVEEKASRYLSVLGVLLVAFGIGGKSVLEEMVPPQGFLDVLPMLLLILFFILVLITMYIIFAVFKTDDLSHIPMNQTVIDFYSDHSYLDVVFAMTKGIVDAIAVNRKVRDTKIRRLSFGYRFMLSSLVVLALFTGSIVVKSFHKSTPPKTQCLKVTLMTDKDSTSVGGKQPNQTPPPKPEPKPEPKPDTTLSPPPFDLFKEGYDPKAGKKPGQDTTKKLNE